MVGVRRLALLVVPVALAACGSSKQAASTTTTTAATTSVSPTETQQVLPPATTPSGSGGVTVTIQAPTHRPKARAPWRYTVRVTSKGRPVIARIYLQVLYMGTPVGSIGIHLVPKGVWTETIRWPVTARGHPLVFYAHVVSGGRTGDARFPVRVR
jgi:hypothetical protein